MTQDTKKLLWLIPITAIIICSAFLIFSLFDNSGQSCPGEGQGKNMDLIYSLLIIIILILVVVVPFTYYHISNSLKKEIENNMQLISQITNKNHDNKQEECSTAESCKKFVLKFLDYNENRVIKKLIENDGSVLQSEISRLPNMGKVKAHRILKDIEIKGIINIEKYGKTNKIQLSDDAKEVLIN